MAIFTFTSPDGKSYDVEGPEGATKEQAYGILQQQLAAATPVAATARPTPGQESDMTSVVADRMKQGAANLLGLAGLPVSAMNQAMRAVGIPVSDKPFGGIDQVTEGWEKLLGVKKVPLPLDPLGKPSKANEYIATTSEFVGGAFIPGVSVVANSSRKLLTAVTMALGNATAGTTSVEGKEIGGNLAPQFGLTKEQGEAIGAMAGGFAGPGMVTLGGQTIAKSTQYSAGVLSKMNITGTSKEAQRAAANGLMNKEIQSSLQFAPESPANIARAAQLKSKIDNFNPNLAQSTDAPGIIAATKEISNKSPEALAKATEQHHKNLAAIEGYKSKVFGEGVTEVGKPLAERITEPAKIKLDIDRGIIAMGLDKAERELRVLSDKFRRQVDNGAVGEELRAKYWDFRAQAQQANRKELAGVYATAKKYRIADDMTDVRDSVTRIISADRNTFQDMPPTFSKVLQEYPAGTPEKFVRKEVTRPGSQRPIYRTETVPGTPGKSTASFEELHSLYKQANRDWADAVVSGNSTRAFYMKTIRDQLQEKVSKYQSPEYGELAQKFSKFNQNYARYSRIFKEGSGGELAKRTKNGIATDSEDIVKKVFLGAGDKKQGIHDFFDIYGKDERAAELLHDGLLDNYSKAAIKDGTFNPAAAKRWLDSHHQALSELPETRKLFSDAAKAADSLVNRRLELVQQRKVLDSSVLAKVAGNERPEQLINQAIADPKVMRALIEGAYTTESKQSIARAIADNISKRDAGYDYLKANAASLKPAMEKLGEGHWDNLLTIAEAEKVLSRVTPPTAVELARLQDIGEQAIGTSVKGMFSRMRNLDKPMGVSKEYLVMDVGGRFFYKTRTEELARLREAAYLDPEVGEVLARLSQKTKYTKQDLLDLQKISFANGVNSTAQAFGVEEDAPKLKSEIEKRLEKTKAKSPYRY